MCAGVYGVWGRSGCVVCAEGVYGACLDGLGVWSGREVLSVGMWVYGRMWVVWACMDMCGLFVLLLFYAIATVFQLYHGGDMI